jgi:putative flavoprotein involved in K+ transport
MSQCLREHSIDHVILERGRVANSWRTERWDSLRLLTPNWQTRLPGYRFETCDADGFMTVPEVVGFIEDYARAISAPVREETEVTSVSAAADGFRVTTDQGEWRCQTVVLASGACNLADVPVLERDVPPSIRTLTAMQYRNPEMLPAGGVMVVGASATGVQIAEEIHRSGRPVTLSVGEHVRLPRTYRGRDILWWMDAAGILDQRYDEVDDIIRARNVPSPQLVGTPDRANLDLNALTDIGVKLVGRLSTVRDGKALFSGGLRNICALADLKMNRLLNTIDEWATDNGADGDADAPHRFDATRVAVAPPLEIDLHAADADGDIRSIVWATGYRPDYSWLDLPALDHKGKLRHDGGIVTVPGVYALGLNFLRRRKSSFIHGAEDDARDITQHLVHYLNGGDRVASAGG